VNRVSEIENEKEKQMTDANATLIKMEGREESVLYG